MFWDSLPLLFVGALLIWLLAAFVFLFLLSWAA